MNQSFTDLLAAVAKQAIKDHRTGFHRQSIMPAARWLKLAGLMTESGELDRRGVSQRRQLLDASCEGSMAPSRAGSEEGRVGATIPQARPSDHNSKSHPWRKRS